MRSEKREQLLGQHSSSLFPMLRRATSDNGDLNAKPSASCEQESWAGVGLAFLASLGSQRSSYPKEHENTSLGEGHRVWVKGGEQVGMAA